MRCTKDMLIKGDWYSISDGDDKSKAYTLEYQDKKYLVIRKGICDFKKCKNACCRFFNEDGMSKNQMDFFKGFGKVSSIGAGINFYIDCNKLCNKTGECKAWNKKSFPAACSQFPHPEDKHYWEVENICSFYFDCLYELKKIGDKVDK